MTRGTVQDGTLLAFRYHNTIYSLGGRKTILAWLGQATRLVTLYPSVYIGGERAGVWFPGGLRILGVPDFLGLPEHGTVF